MKKPAKEAGIVVVPSLLHFVSQGEAGLEPGRPLRNCSVEGRALIKHPVGVFSEEPDCSDGREERDCRGGLLIQKNTRI
jgi:hypothetical protein